MVRFLKYICFSPEKQGEGELVAHPPFQDKSAKSLTSALLLGGF